MFVTQHGVTKVTFLSLSLSLSLPLYRQSNVDSEEAEILWSPFTGKAKGAGLLSARKNEIPRRREKGKDEGREREREREQETTSYTENYWPRKIIMFLQRIRTFFAIHLDANRVLNTIGLIRLETGRMSRR